MQTIFSFAFRFALAVSIFLISTSTSHGAGKTVIWKGGVSSDWDTVTANWRTNATETTTYEEGDTVIFDESTTASDVNLTGPLSPAFVRVDTSGLTYRLTGPGEITGNATLFKDGLWILIVANNHSYSGGTVIQRGFLLIGDNGTTGSLGSGNITNNADLVINRTGTLNLPNDISGRGRLTVSLDARVVLSGANTYTNNTVVRFGNLVLNGINSGGGLLTNEPPATVSGRGTNSGPVAIAGKLSPGDPIGTLTTGSLTLMPGATNVMDLGAANTVGGGVNDLIVVNGNLTLNNNRLVLNVPQAPATGVPYRLIRYTGARNGTFNSAIVLNGSELPPAALSYDDAGKTVNVTFQGAAFPPMVIYRETFGVSSEVVTDLPARTFDWEVFDSQGAPFAGVNLAAINFDQISRPTNVFNINAGPNSDGTFGAYPRGLVFFNPDPSPSLGFTTEFRIDPANYVPGSILFSWYEGNGNAAQTFRMLVRVSDSWYASDATFSTPAISILNFGTEAQLKTHIYNPAASNWWRINFNGNYTPGLLPGTGVSTSSSLGTVSRLELANADLNGAITGFGVYGENLGATVGNRRIDSFTVEAAPLGTGFAPVFSAVQFSAGNVILRATNGPPNWTVRLLATTDVTAPFASWVGVKTGTFDGSGNLSITNTTAAGAANVFYRLQSP